MVNSHDTLVTYFHAVCVGADDEDLAPRWSPEVVFHSQHGLDRQDSQLQHSGLFTAPQALCGNKYEAG